VLSPFHQYYLLGWLTVCGLAAAVALRHKRALLAEWRRYPGLLLVRWKLVTFVPTLLFVTFAGHDL
jgi:hypothetical protein